MRECLIIKERLLEAAAAAKEREISEDLEELKKHPELKEFGNYKPLSAYGQNTGKISLERKCGIKATSFYKVVCGHSNFSLKKLKIIADYTGVSIDYLLGLSDNKYLIREEKK